MFLSFLFPLINTLCSFCGGERDGEKHREEGGGETETGGERAEAEERENMSTITIPKYLPSPEEDSQSLKQAFDGLGTDENAVIQILGHRSAQQRVRIADAYRRLYKESLIDRLHSELSGDFRKAVILWTLDPADRDAQLANEALKHIKKRGDKHLRTIVEIACASSPNHLMAVRKAYCNLYNYSLEEDIDLHFAQQESARRLLVRLVTAFRYYGEDVDEAVARSEAAELRDAIRSKPPHHDDIIRILGLRSNPHLKSIFNHYRQDFGKTMEEEIEGNKGNDELFSSILKIAVCCLNYPEKYFAQVVRTSVVGLGTDEDSLTRAIVTRAEIDMKKMREEYKMLFRKTITSDIKGDTSGDYKNFLLTLVGWED